MENNITIDFIHEVIREKVRKKYNKNETPSVAIIDSQSVQTTRKGSENRGFDGGKKVKGKKRHIGVVTLGLLLVVAVRAANGGDSKVAFEVLEKLKGAVL